MANGSVARRLSRVPRFRPVGDPPSLLDLRRGGVLASTAGLV